jgi:hypothetical protein
MCTNKPININTNYYDLPGMHEETFHKHLEMSKDHELTEKSVKVVKNYLERTVLIGKSPFGADITSNYFWFIYNALPKFVGEKERHNGYYKNECDLDFRDRLVAYAIYRVDRSPENIKKIFDYVQPFLTGLMPKTKYEHMNLDKKVNNLIQCNDMLSEINNYKEALTEFYNKTYTSDGKMIVEGNPAVSKHYNDAAYGYSTHVLAEELSKHLNLNRYSALYARPCLSFWMRRNHEGNMEVVYDILKRVKGVYE